MFYGIPEFHRLKEWEKLNIPFEYNDFMWPGVLDDEKEVRRRVEAYRTLNRDRSADTLHGPFLNIAVHSQDRLIREASESRIRQVCDIAGDLNIRAVIVHTNFIPNFYDATYRRGWLDANEAFFTQLAQAYPELWIYMENMFDEEPDSLAALARRMDGQRFGIALDIAHANLSKTSISQWHRVCAPYIRHYHINDNHGLLDEHLPLGRGNIPWDTVLPLLKADATKLLEVRSLEDYLESAHMVENTFKEPAPR